MKLSYFLIWIVMNFMHLESQNDFDNEYAVEMDMDALEANLDLSAYNIEVIRKVNTLGNVYHLKHTHSCKDARCKRDVSETILSVLKKHPMIHRVEEQVDLEVEQKIESAESDYFYDDRDLNFDMQKKAIDNLDEDLSRDFDTDTEVEKKPMMTSFDEYHDLILHLAPNVKTNKKNWLDTPHRELSKDDKEYQQLVKQRDNNLNGLKFNDPESGHLWQYHNNGQFDNVNPGLDMNIFSVYKANITGRGIVVTVIDDGIDTKSQEIKKNFDAAASLDLNDPRNRNSNPRGPGYRKRIPESEAHGTMCGSVIAGEANNGFCAFGVAYNANLGGIRMLAQNMVTDLLEAYALTHNNQYIDIYSNSWGPKDTGAKTAPVTYYVKKALEIGTTKGRHGKGSIFLFAAGNGGMNHDHCGADGFVNSPYIIAVTSINIYGRKPAYTEECSAISIAAAVGGFANLGNNNENLIDPRLSTSEINNACSSRFVGTSAATPLVAGCIALALEANHHLNWRDIQYLFTISSRIPNPFEMVWQLNTAGLLSSHMFGSGLLDCTAFVRNAQLWRSVGPERVCVAGKTDGITELKIKSQKRTRVTFQTTACEHTDKSIDRLEHVIIHTKIQHPCRGDLAITLTSPTNTKSFLLKNRAYDKNDATVSFSFLSLMNWGENPRGKWHFDIIDIAECTSRNKSRQTGSLLEVVLELHGTTETHSGIYKNKDLFETYFKNIQIIPPTESIILNEKQVYNYYNLQRKYFIQLNTVHKEVLEYKENYKKYKSKTEIESFRKKISLLKTKIPEDELKFLNSLLHNTKA